MHGMMCNLTSIRQLLEKGFSITKNGNFLQLFDPHKKLVLNSILSNKKLFKCGFHTSNKACFSKDTHYDHEWLWNMRYGHLNFRIFSELSFINFLIWPTLTDCKKNSCE